MFDRYRLMLGSIAASSTDDEVAVAASRMSADTATYQRNCVERVSQLTALSKQCSDLDALCNREMAILSKLQEDIRNDTIGR